MASNARRQSLLKIRTVAGLPRPELTVADLISLVATHTADAGPRRTPPQSDPPAQEPERLPYPPRADRGPQYLPRVAEQPARVVVEMHPETLRGRTGDALPARLAELPYPVEPLFPGADPAGQVFKLGDYFMITLPVNRGEAGALGHDIAYQMRDYDGVEHTFYEGAYLNYAPLGSLLGCDDPTEDRGWSRQAIRLPAAEALLAGRRGGRVW
jgi:hypothetical protein